MVFSYELCGCVLKANQLIFAATMSSSSSEDEMGEAFKESAGCDYITKLVEAPKKSNLKELKGDNKREFNFGSDEVSMVSNRVDMDEGDIDKFKETGFEKFLATRLASRLDECIKIVEKKKRCLPSVDSSSECGIRLFSCSPKVTELIEIAYESPSPARHRTTAVSQKSVDYNLRAEEAAVSALWVADPSNTALWKDNKKPRVISAKVVRNLSNGGFECLPLSDR